MSELFGVFKQYLVWGLILWMLFFTAFTALFARGQLIAFASGLLRVLASLIVTPFIFISRAVSAVHGYSSDEEARYRASNQYLLNKGMLVMQAIVIVVAIGTLAAAVVLTWNTLVPPGEIRRAAREYKAEVETQRQKVSDENAKVAGLDSEWASKQMAVVQTFRRERQRQIDVASRDMRRIESTLALDGGPNALATLQRVKETIASRSSNDSGQIRYTRSWLDSIVNNNWYWLGDSNRQQLLMWNDHWETKVRADLALRTVSVQDLRNQEQPDHAAAAASRDRETETLRQMESILVDREQAASLKWKAAAKSALGSFVTFLLFVWLLGALIEGGWMAIHVADDIRRVRERETQTAEQAVPEMMMGVRDVSMGL